MSSTANELAIFSPSGRERTAPVFGSTVPTTPFVDANHSRPLQSGSAEMILSPGSTTVERS